MSKFHIEKVTLHTIVYAAIRSCRRYFVKQYFDKLYKKINISGSPKM